VEGRSIGILIIVRQLRKHLELSSFEAEDPRTTLSDRLINHNIMKTNTGMKGTKNEYNM